MKDKQEKQNQSFLPPSNTIDISKISISANEFDLSHPFYGGVHFKINIPNENKNEILLSKEALYKLLRGEPHY
ncbi:MAG: hypothetical protein ABI367_02550 [Mucilaginibacter sp.]